jgi:hypothetical protein
MTQYRYPETSVFYRDLTREFPLAVRGEGCWIIDAAGKRYLDGSGGAFVATVGHGVAEIAEAVAEQARTLPYVNGTHFTSEPVERLAATLVDRAPGDLSLAYFLTSGSDAVEAALKLARQYWVEVGEPRKHKVLSLTPGYHGNTMLALAASGRPRYKAYFRDWLTPVPRVAAPYPYRCACRGAAPLCPACTGDALEQVLLEEDPETVAAFIAEPVGGSSTGASVPPPEYWPRIRKLCDQYGVLWIADEILAGAGRTGVWSPLERYGVSPDLMVMGKGITGGYAPLGVVLAPRRLVDRIAQGSGSLMHAQTYVHHPLSCAAGLATLRYLDQHDLVTRCQAMGELLHAGLAGLKGIPLVGDIRGIGLLAGIELVADRATRAPFSRKERVAERCIALAMEAGLVLWPSTGQADGMAGDLLMIAPPFTISPDEITQLVDRLHGVLTRMHSELTVTT